MIINEQQITQLIYFATEYRKQLLEYKSKLMLNEAGQRSLEDISNILTSIVNQQESKLEVIND